MEPGVSGKAPTKVIRQTAPGVRGYGRRKGRGEVWWEVKERH